VDVYEVPFLVYIKKFGYLFPKVINILNEFKLLLEKEAKLKQGYFLLFQHAPNVDVSANVMSNLYLNFSESMLRINDLLKLKLSIIKKPIQLAVVLPYD
jgi:hypothetical protein